MKKLVFATALTLGSLTATIAATPVFHDGIMETVIVSEFVEIQNSEVPQPVLDALAKDHAGATLDKAYVNEEKQYKLDITQGDGTTATLYADAEGNWLDL